MNLTSLTLAPDVDPWERQPGETPRRHAQFLAYRDLGRARTLQEASERLALHASHVRAVAAAFRWRDRAAAWDQHRDQLDAALWLEERRAAAREDARILSGLTEAIAEAIEHLDPTAITPSVLARLVDVVMRQRRALFGDVTAALTATCPAVDRHAAEAEEFAALTPEQRRERLRAAVEAGARRLRAIEGTDDEDDDQEQAPPVRHKTSADTPATPYQDPPIPRLRTAPDLSTGHPQPSTPRKRPLPARPRPPRDQARSRAERSLTG
ncbi:hypothetical protein [Streptomyces sp. NPDC002788]